MTVAEIAASSLLDVLGRTRITRLDDVIEASIQGSNDVASYRVRVDGRHDACSCPAAIYTGRRDSRPCKHITALRLIRRALPPALGGETRHDDPRSL